MDSTTKQSLQGTQLQGTEKKMKTHGYSNQKESKDIRYLLTLDLKPTKINILAKNSRNQLCYRKTLEIDSLITSRNGDGKIKQTIRILSGSPTSIRKMNQF